jgi:hypothetical protein
MTAKRGDAESGRCAVIFLFQPRLLCHLLIVNDCVIIEKLIPCGNPEVLLLEG